MTPPPKKKASRSPRGKKKAKRTTKKKAARSSGMSRALRNAASLAKREHPNVPEEFTDSSRGIRLQKALAEAGVASRRHCEEFIEAGRVRVNDKVVAALPAWVDPDHDKISFDGQIVHKPRKTRAGKPAGKMYLLVNKPKRVISTNDDPEGRKTVLELLDPSILTAAGGRLYPVGRLDSDSVGLILMTNDGELANQLTHPRYGITKQYQVTIPGKLEEKDVAKLRKGLLLVDRKADRKRSTGEDSDDKAPVKRAAMEQVRILRYDKDRTRGDRTLLSVTLREGQNREIRRLLARIGIKVKRLERVAMGPLRLKGVARGSYRVLTAAEVRSLKRAVKTNK